MIFTACIFLSLLDFMACKMADIRLYFTHVNMIHVNICETLEIIMCWFPQMYFTLHAILSHS